MGSIKRKKVEPQKHKKEDVEGSYKFTYIKFNFSFLSTNKKYNFENPKVTTEVKAYIFDRILELSQDTIISLGALGRKNGFETIEEKNIKISASCDRKFFDNEVRVRKCSEKYYIFRIFPNNNPYPARFIGKWLEGIFYIFFIDLEHKYV